MQKRQAKYLSAIESWRLKLQGWKRNWYNYVVDIQELTWCRNLHDGYIVDVYNKEGLHIDRVTV